MDSDKHVWIISELYFPSGTSTGQILTTIAEGLAANANVSVFTGPGSYWEKSEPYALKETINNVIIHRIKVPYLDKNKIWKRILRLSIISLSLSIKAITKIPKNADILIVTNPIPLLLLISIIGKFKNYNINILVHDVYPDNMAAAGLISKTGIFFRILNLIFSATYRSAKVVIVLGRDMKDILSRKSVKKIKIIENWAETNLISPKPKLGSDLVSALKLEDKFVFLFAGNFGRVQGLELLLDAAELTTSKNIHFLFAGNGALNKRIENSVAANPKKYSLIGTYSRDEQSNILRSCDVGIVSLAVGMYGLGVPSKAYNLMAASKPILYIGDKSSEIDLVISEFDCGWSIQPESKVTLSRMLDKIALYPQTQLQNKGKNALALANCKYTKDSSLSMFNELL